MGFGLKSISVTQSQAIMYEKIEKKQLAGNLCIFFLNLGCFLIFVQLIT